jgi:hypothetical protein
MKQIRAFYSSHPIIVILLVALVLRLVAVFLSQGYAMHDDHFLIIESSSSWSHGHDYNKWLPATQQRWVDLGLKDEVRPEGHSLVYPGVHYLLFEGMQACGLENPKAQMFVVRFLHALFGVWLVYLVFSFAKRITNESNARTIAWVSALGWAMAFLSVRNLVEIVCIPFMMLALIQVHKGLTKDGWKYGVLAGLCIAIAISIRYQLFVFFGVLGLILLLQKRWKLCLSMLLGFALGFGVLQGLLDYYIWGYPFAEMYEYFFYNSSEARFEYAEGNASFFGLNYWLVLAFVTLPVLGVFWFFGFFQQWRSQFWLFAPTIAFLIFHMAYINLQERFIFPIMHLVLILGVVGWNDFQASSKFWKNKASLWEGVKKMSWGLNVVLLVFAISYFGKKARVEAAYFLYHDTEFSSAFQENTNDGYIPMMPMHYSGKWDFGFTPIRSVFDWEECKGWSNRPNLVFFHGSENLDARVQSAENYLGDLVQLAEFQPSWQDRLIQWINPMNRNDAIYLYNVIETD